MLFPIPSFALFFFLNKYFSNHLKNTLLIQRRRWKFNDVRGFKIISTNSYLTKFETNKPLRKSLQLELELKFPMQYISCPPTNFNLIDPLSPESL